MLIKSLTDIKNIEENGKRMGEILEKLTALCRPGVSALEIDLRAERLIKRAGGRPAFKGYRTNKADRPFPGTICASVNEELVHGIARKGLVLKDGDIFSIDIGMAWPVSKTARPVFSDTAVTIAIGEIPAETMKLLAVTKQALEEGIRAAMPGNSVAMIGKAVESYVKSQGKYGIVRDLVGHGVGHQVHEEPYIPNYYDPELESVKLVPGMVIAIEPMIALGKPDVITKSDGWTIKMKDNSRCAHFEHTIIITEAGNVVATRRPGEKRT